MRSELSALRTLWGRPLRRADGRLWLYPHEAAALIDQLIEADPGLGYAPEVRDPRDLLLDRIWERRCAHAWWHTPIGDTIVDIITVLIDKDLVHGRLDHSRLPTAHDTAADLHGQRRLRGVGPAGPR